MAQENVATIDLHNGGAANGCSKAVSFFALKPQLVVQAPKAVDAVQFYKTAFGAEELKRTLHPKRKAEQELPLILSAELKLGSSVFLICDQTEDSDTSVKSDGNSGIFCVETNDVDGAVSKAVNAGASIVGEISEGEGGAGCGGRVGKVKDPYGYVWIICSPATECADGEA